MERLELSEMEDYLSKYLKLNKLLFSMGKVKYKNDDKYKGLFNDGR